MSDCIVSFSVFINLCCSSVLCSKTTPITVDSDDGILNVGCKELVLSLLELSVIVDDSANDNDDCACCCVSIDSVINDDVCRSVDSVVVLSSSLIFCSVAIASEEI